jgi:class 3 adenylate cyclase
LTRQKLRLTLGYLRELAREGFAYASVKRTSWVRAAAEPNTVVIGESTRRLLGNLFELHDLGPRDLKGIASNRLSTELGRNAAQARVGPARCMGPD